MKRTLVLSMIFAILISAPQFAYSEDKEKDYTPELISTLDLSEQFTRVSKITLMGNYALIQGSKKIGERQDEGHDCLVDISDPDKPVLVWDKTPDKACSIKCFYKDYAYGIESDRESANFKVQVIDIHDPANPQIVNTIDTFSHLLGNAVIVGDQLLVTETKRGVIHETKFYLYSLDDPANPELITDKLYDAQNNEECHSLPYYPRQLLSRNNIVYVVSSDNISLLIVSEDKISIPYIFKSLYRSIYDFAIIEETMDNFSLYCFLAGSAYSDLKYQDELETDLSKRERKFGLSLVSHELNTEYIRSSFGMGLGQSVRLPINISDVIPNRTVAYVFGYEMPKVSSRQTKLEDLKSKLLVVDFTVKNAPRIINEIALDHYTRAVAHSKGYIYRIDDKSKFHIYKFPKCTAEFERITTSTSEYKPTHFDARFVENPTEKGIEEILRMDIGKPDGELTESDFKDVTILNLDASQITTLEGIQLCTNLEELYVTWNYLTDITPLGELTKLNTLDLSFNRIENIEPLSNLKNLEILNIRSNKIKDINPILGLRKLDDLIISGIREVDITGLAKLPNLKKLDISSTKIKDISFIETMHQLESLDAGFNEITDFTPISKLIRLETLDISDNLIRDYSQITRLANLKKLDINRNKISDISFLNNLTKLETLDLSNNRIEDISLLAKLKELTYLKLRINKVSDLSPLAKLKKLDRIGLERNEIEDISPLANLTSLTTSLYLSENKIKDISPLSSLNKLESLYIENNQVTDISPVAEMKALKKIRISNNQISDISALASHKTLESIDISKNQITDISSILKLPNLTSANLTSNKIKGADELLNDKRKDTYLVVFLHDNEMDDAALTKLNHTLHGSNIILGPDRNEQNCVNALSSFIECSASFKEKRNDKTFGTWEDITNAYMASKESKLDDFVPRYKVVLFEIKPSVIEGGKVIKESTITILAVPKEGNENLRTFAMTQDMEPLEWIGDYELTDFSSLSLDNDKEWKKWPCGYYSGGYSYHSG